MRNKKECPAVDQPTVEEKPVVKRGRKPKKAAETSGSKVVAGAVVSPKVKKVVGRTKEGRLQKMNAEIEALMKKRDALFEECSAVSFKLNGMIENTKSLTMLLSAFNALTDKGDVKFEKPEKGTDYWYVRPMPTLKRFEVISCQWHDRTSDHYRYCKGNVFLDEDICNSVCVAMNEMLSEL